MSFQWVLVAFFLYFEVGLVFLLCLPIISATRWSRIFNSKLLGWLATHGNYYFGIVVVILLILFIDALNQMRRYGNEKDVVDPAANMQTHTYHTMMKFRGQRNFYITGFSLLLMIVLRRLISTFCLQASLEAKYTAALQQAKSASDQAERFMDEADKLKKAAREELTTVINTEDEEKRVKLEKRNEALKEELNEARKETDKVQTELMALKKQAEGVSNEYDRLLKGHDKLQEKVKELEGGDTEDKKDQ
ncbi:B-cell receptor-associated protein 31-like [Corticium candelabrum]|uniref:B-cell receptor-associated protein 31-like n=1 Tax=Corticium candelabrum TaxID=121492 RepID=UPI002E26DA7C|nr:B-cell receptor-associated protein 31-like [Corticium candelabrum]